jgi:hypothetical protein
MKPQFAVLCKRLRLEKDVCIIVGDRKNRFIFPIGDSEVEKHTETIIGSTIFLKLPTKTVRNRKKVQVVEKWRGNTSLLDAGRMSSIWTQCC